VSVDELAVAASHIAAGVRARAAQLATAEERLTAFAWREDSGDTRRPEPWTWTDASSLVVRALRTALEDDTWRVLGALARDGDATLGMVAERLEVPRLAAVDRVGAWTQAGLVGRDLETDRVGVTDLGRGIVELVELLVRETTGEGER